MPKDFYDKLQIISNATKDNKAIILLAITILCSGATNTMQFFQGEETIFLNNAMKEQITILANAYVKPINLCKK